MRPKWLLTHPRGTFMLTEAIRGLSPQQFGRIVIVALRAHDEEYGFQAHIVRELTDVYGLDPLRVDLVLLKKETASQPETVYAGIRSAGVSGAIFVKDSDNCFSLPHQGGGNFVAVVNLHSAGAIEAGNKSYVRVDSNGCVTEIVEKQVISDRFCCGGYAFADAAQYCSYFEKLSETPGLYVSHIIQAMLRNGHRFATSEATGFEDWGTLRDWRRYQNRFATILVNLDGIIVFDSSRHFEPKWGATEALGRNVRVLNQLYDTGRVHIVVTTSRGEDFRSLTEEQLRKHGLRYHSILMGLPHASRQVLINDFGKERLYEAASAINLRTNDDRLDEVLAALLQDNILV